MMTDKKPILKIKDSDKRLLLFMFYGFITACFTYLLSVLLQNPIATIIATLSFLILFCFTVLGFGLLPVLIYKIARKKPLGRYLSSLPGIGLGFLIAMLGVNPLLMDWEDTQRNASGKEIAAYLHEYRNNKGEFPASLQGLKIDELKNKMHFPFGLNKFWYQKTEDNFELMTDANLFDSYVWDDKEGVFEYQDF